MKAAADHVTSCLNMMLQLQARTGKLRFSSFRCRSPHNAANAAALAESDKL